jgi:hypothetical protein
LINNQVQNNQHVLGNPLIVDPNIQEQYQNTSFQNNTQIISPSIWREMGPAYPHH